MEKSVSAQKSPYKIKVEKGKTYSWCTCGLSQRNSLFVMVIIEKKENLSHLNILLSVVKKCFFVVAK